MVPSSERLKESCNLHPQTSEEAGKIIDTVLRDYVDFWFAPLSEDKEFRNAVQDALVFAVGSLIIRARQRFNLIEFVLDKGAMLLRHHLALYTEVRPEPPPPPHPPSLPPPSR